MSVPRMASLMAGWMFSAPREAAAHQPEQRGDGDPMGRQRRVFVAAAQGAITMRGQDDVGERDESGRAQADDRRQSQAPQADQTPGEHD